MKHSLVKIITVGVALSLILASCYRGKLILAKWADGSPRIVRYYKRKDPLTKKVVTYFKTGQVQSVEYFHHSIMLEGYLYKEWYISGAKRAVRRDWYKDTVTTFNPADSNVTLTGFVNEESTSWFENGKPRLKAYSKDTNTVFEYNNAKGDSLVTVPMGHTRADGYTEFTIKSYIGK
jgi:hypothetical protein